MNNRQNHNTLLKQCIQYKNNYERDEELLEKIERAAFDNISANDAIEIIRALLDEDESED